MGYNSCVKPSEQVRAGDFIVKVNGLQGDSLRLVDILNEEAHLGMLVRRPYEFCVAVDKEGQTLLGDKEGKKKEKKHIGMEFVSKPAGKSLMILEITDRGPVAAWNYWNPDQVVRAGDRIIGVNGEPGKAQDLLRKMKNADRFLMTVVRPIE